MILYTFLLALAWLGGESFQQDTIPGFSEPIQSIESPSFFQFAETDIEVITPESLTDEEKIFYIRDQWRFRSGDDPEWADPGLDDSDWEFVSTNLTQADLAFVDWSGLGWFRKQLQVDPRLIGKPIALLVDRHLGASEIYLNGEKIHELGEFSTQPERVETYSRNQPIVIVFPNREVHTLAVRFINPNYSESGRLLGNNGFRFLLGDWDTHQNERFSFIAAWTGTNMFYIGVLLTFSLIHLLLFLFYPIEIRNLYFSLFAGGLVLIAYLFYRIELANYTFETIYFMRFMLVSEVLVLAFATRFTHSIDKELTPFFANALLIAGFMVALLIWLYPYELMWLRELAVLVFVVEILRSLYLMFHHRRSGVGIIGFGVFVFVLGLVISIMINFGFLNGSAQSINMLGSGALILSMSIFLSRDFASTQKNLELKIHEISELSKMALEQEKINKEREIETRLLEAENKRKTSELEEARALQLSMLPRKMPVLSNLDIAVYMQTATEVGGDYYDYSIGPDNSIVLALGDVTGHGMKAGIMVAAAKSYFHTLVHEEESLAILRKISSGLRNMNMRMMYMGFILAHYRKGDLKISIAGMPPALHYSNEENCVNQIILKGLPLGSKTNYPYKSSNLKLKSGDVVLLMSDGLTELFNEKREMLGYEKIKNILLDSAGYSSNDIINHLKQLSESWAAGSSPQDDITLMVLKVPEN